MEYNTDLAHLKERVHTLMNAGDLQGAVGLLYYRFGHFVDDEMASFAIEPHDTVIDKLSVNVAHIIEDNDLTKIGADIVREPLDYLDRVQHSTIPYWSLDEADEFDVEEPEPLDEETMDMMINNLDNYV